MRRWRMRSSASTAAAARSGVVAWALVALGAAGPTAAASPPEPTPLIVLSDASAGRFIGALGRFPFQRRLEDGETAAWVDTDGPQISDITLVPINGILVPMPVDTRPAERALSLSALRAAVDDEALGRVFDGVLVETLRARGTPIVKRYRAQGMQSGFVGRALADAPAERAFAIERVVNSDLVQLSWDNRQVVLLMRGRHYRAHHTVRSVRARELGARTVFYLGPELAGCEPDACKARWAEAGGTPLLDAVRAGFEAILPLALDTTPEVPDVADEESVALSVNGAARLIPGRLWKQDAEHAYLFNADGGVTVVALGAPASAGR